MKAGGARGAARLAAIPAAAAAFRVGAPDGPSTPKPASVATPVPFGAEAAEAGDAVGAEAAAKPWTSARASAKRGTDSMMK
ncbi:MAG: hypothetical protein DMF67_09640 [Acidobacteria bacterium]|nr:MAG: hypothetical protein DMF66_03540 [Acidobacteriota bacterium]PYS83299.1 MAG: hypothetical protein DMF67_09640 [Acidobacteriota bacterium]